MMNHSVNSMMFLGAFLFGLLMCFTSCEDILGTWDKPAPANVTPSGGDDDGGGSGTTTGLLAGKFTINAGGNQVQFSQGNLQATYDGTKWTWAFAEHQWDYVGNAAGNTSINGNGTVSDDNVTVDLFGWVGASNTTWTGAAQYGISNNKDYPTTTSTYGDVADEALKSDWGTLAITNGGNTANYGWRTLTKDEWVYLFNTRTTTSGIRYAKATVNGKSGVILLPDNWSTSYHSLNSANTTDAAFTTNGITSAMWTDDFESHGAVFLPAAGMRDGSLVKHDGSYGRYWSSSLYVWNSAYRVIFYSDNLNPEDYGLRYYGVSVRLVRDAE